MEDERLWEFEHELWVCGPEVYRERVDETCLMALPAEPFLFDGPAAVRAVQDTPRWDRAELTDRRVSRPQEGLIVIGYRVRAERGAKAYHAACTSTLRRLAHDDWRVVQHQQTPFGAPVADPDG